MATTYVDARRAAEVLLSADNTPYAGVFSIGDRGEVSQSGAECAAGAAADRDTGEGAEIASAPGDRVAGPCAELTNNGT